MLLPLWLCTIVVPIATGELDFRGQGPALQILIALQIEQRVLAVRAIEFFRNVVDDDVVPIFAAEAMIAVGRHHLEAMSFDPHERDVEGAAAKVENENRLVFIELVESIGQRRRGRLIDDLQDIQAGQAAGGDRGGAFGIIEISRHGDDRIGHRYLEIFFRIRLQLLEDESGKFLGGVGRAAELPVKLFLRFAHFALDEIDDFLRFRDGVILRNRPDDGFAAIEQNDRGRDALTFSVWDDLRFSVGIDVRDGREGGAEIDSDCFAIAHVL